MKGWIIIILVLISSISFGQSQDKIPAEIKTRNDQFKGAKFYRKDTENEIEIYNFRKQRHTLIKAKNKIPSKDQVLYQVYYDTVKKKKVKVKRIVGYSNPGKWIW